MPTRPTSPWTRRRFLGATGLAATVSGVAPGTLAEEDIKNRTTARAVDEETIEADVLVCGGGPSGMAASVMAARGGAKVLLVERYGRLGGMAVQARVGPLMGRSASPFV